MHFGVVENRRVGCLLHSLGGEGFSKEIVLHVSQITKDRKISCLHYFQSVRPRLAQHVVFRVNLCDRLLFVLVVGSS
jgi:hypothetical protein